MISENICKSDHILADFFFCRGLATLYHACNFSPEKFNPWSTSCPPPSSSSADFNLISAVVVLHGGVKKKDG